jgi:hypothetical protein
VNLFVRSAEALAVSRDLVPAYDPRVATRIAALVIGSAALAVAACGGHASVDCNASGDCASPAGPGDQSSAASSEPGSSLVIAPDGPSHSAAPPSAVDGLPSARLSTAAVDFGAVSPGDAVPAHIQVVNDSDAPIPVRIVGFSGGSGSAFTAVMGGTGADGVTSVDAHGSTDLVITFAPTAAAIYAGTLGLHLCDGGCIANVDLAGLGDAAPIVCTSRVDFMKVLPGHCSTGVVLCTNRSPRAQTITSWALLDPAPSSLVLDTSSTPTTLAPAAQQEIDLSYCPAAIEQVSGALEVHVDALDPRDALVTIPLSGSTL